VAIGLEDELVALDPEDRADLAALRILDRRAGGHRGGDRDGKHEEGGGD
jgi:hypothetical protein